MTTQYLKLNKPMTSEKTNYNGWTNYETWNVKLWMDNDQGSQERFAEMAKEVFSGATASKTFTRMEEAAFALRDQLKDEYENEMQDTLEDRELSASVWADLLGAALGNVNFYEIAVNLLENVE